MGLREILTQLADPFSTVQMADWILISRHQSNQFCDEEFSLLNFCFQIFFFKHKIDGKRRSRFHTNNGWLWTDKVRSGWKHIERNEISISICIRTYVTVRAVRDAHSFEFFSCPCSISLSDHSWNREQYFMNCSIVHHHVFSFSFIFLLAQTNRNLFTVEISAFEIIALYTRCIWMSRHESESNFIQMERRAIAIVVFAFIAHAIVMQIERKADNVK